MQSTLIRLLNIRNRTTSDVIPPSRCVPTLPSLPESAGVSHIGWQIADVQNVSAGAFSTKFRIDGVIGAGGMGVVVVAQHLALDKRVAIKLMRPELRFRRDLVRRFLREARAAARLNSPYIAQVFDVGTLEDGAPYIVMEWLDGVDLAAWLRQHGPASVPVAATMLSQVSAAIAEAHAIGIVHRDLKPANLFVTHDSDGTTLMKVLDLGICKLVGRADDLPDTSLGMGLGTPAYMAPELRAGARHADARSDIWSLGAILYELVTGRVSFQEQARAELCVRRDPYPPISHMTVTNDFEAIIARCLAKDPAARFQAVTELEAALAPFVLGSCATVRASAGSQGRSRQWTLPAIVATCAIAVALGASHLKDMNAISVSSQVKTPPIVAPEYPATAVQERATVVNLSASSTQQDTTLQRHDPARAQPAPAVPAASQRKGIRSTRTTRAARNSLYTVESGAVSEPPPPRASVDPLATPY